MAVVPGKEVYVLSPKLLRRFMYSIIPLALATFLFYRANTQCGELCSEVSSSDLLNSVFTQPDGSPCNNACMFGLHRGETKLADISTVLRSHPYIMKHFSSSDFSKPYSWGEWIQATTRDLGFQFWIIDSIYYGGAVWTGNQPDPWLERKPSQEMPTLAQIIHTFGIPEYVGLLKGPGFGQWGKAYYDVELAYPQKTLSFSFIYSPDATLNPHDRPMGFYVQRNSYNPREEGSWHGFQSIQDYIHIWNTPVTGPLQ
jgi:hypothetical protein